VERLLDPLPQQGEVRAVFGPHALLPGTLNCQGETPGLGCTSAASASLRGPRGLLFSGAAALVTSR
jgi:hypothetical protein